MAVLVAHQLPEVHFLGHVREQVPVFVLRLAQRHLGLLALGDVERGADVAEQFAAVVKIRQRAVVHPAHTAVGPHDAVFQFVHRIALQGGAEGLVQQGRVVGMNALGQHHVIRRRWPGRIQPVNPVLFLGPHGGPRRGDILKAADVRHPLALGEQIPHPLQFLFGLLALDQVRRLPDEQVQPPQVLIVRAVRRGPVRGEDAQQLAVARPQRRGLDGAHPGRAQHRQRRRAGKQRALFHVLDDDALAAFRGFAAHGGDILGGGKELQERARVAVLRLDAQRVAVHQLQGALVRPHDGDRRVHDLLQQRGDVPRVPAPGGSARAFGSAPPGPWPTVARPACAR